MGIGTRNRSAIAAAGTRLKWTHLQLAHFSSSLSLESCRSQANSNRSLSRKPLQQFSSPGIRRSKFGISRPARTSKQTENRTAIASIILGGGTSRVLPNISNRLWRGRVLLIRLKSENYLPLEAILRRELLVALHNNFLVFFARRRNSATTLLVCPRFYDFSSEVGWERIDCRERSPNLCSFNVMVVINSGGFNFLCCFASERQERLTAEEESKTWKNLEL